MGGARPGGWLVVTETPNRFWPREVHTTGRWFISWMPSERMFRTVREDDRFRGCSDVDLYRAGTCGSTYRELLECLGHPADCEEVAREVSGYVARLYRDARVKTRLRGALVAMFGPLEVTLRRAFRRPVMAFAPWLNHVAFRKRRPAV